VWRPSSCLTADTLRLYYKDQPLNVEVPLTVALMTQRTMQLPKGCLSPAQAVTLLPRHSAATIKQVTSPCCEHPLNSTIHEARLQAVFLIPVCLPATLSLPQCLQRPSAKRVRVESPQRTFISWHRTVWYCNNYGIYATRRSVVTSEHKSDHRYSYGCRYIETS
jgi:hypothetical protein